MKAPPVRKLMLDDLARSGLKDTDARRLHLKPVLREESRKLKLTHSADGYVIPYFDPGGKVTKFFRYRLLSDIRSGFEKLSGAKVLKYIQPPKTMNEVYLAPFVNWSELLDSNVPLIITEGEKKAAAATKVGAPTIGIGGVWNFQSTKNGVSFLKGLEQFNWKERIAYVVFDSDAAANVDVRLAAQRLSDRLRERGAVVHVGYLPSSGRKVGLDDYLVERSVDELSQWLESLPLLDSSLALHKMNDLVTYVADPGLIYVNGTGQRISPRAFKEHAFAHHSYTERIETKNTLKMRKVKTADEWLSWAHRAAVYRLVYEPGQPRHVDSNLNLWNGYGVAAKRGDVKPWHDLLQFLFGKEDKNRVWFEQWVAYPFQYPGVKLRTASLLWGKARGTGKSLVGFTLGDLYGENYSLIGDNDLENQGFNTWAMNKQFVFADELTGQNNRKFANLLKTMITRETVTVNMKYVPQFSIRDCINYYFTSNEPDAFYLDAAERRYFIHEVRADAPLERSFYDRYDKWRRSEEGRAALLYHLLGVPTDTFDPMAPAPETRAKSQMVSLTRTELETYVDDVAKNPDDFLGKYGGGELTTIQELVAAFDGGDGRRASPVLMARKLKSAGVEHVLPRGYQVSQVRLTNGVRVVFYPLKHREKWMQASAEEMRKHYEDHRSIKGAK